MLLLLIPPLILWLFLVVSFIRPLGFWQNLGIKGPMGWLFFGNMLKFALGKKSYGEVYEGIYNEYPHLKYVGFYRLFNEPALLIRDQDLIRQILMGNHFTNCSDNAVYVDPNKDTLASCNPFIASGEKWRLYRSDLVPLFTPSRLRQIMAQSVTDSCQKLRIFLQNRSQFEAKELATRFTLQVVASAVFGLDSKCLESGESTGRNPWLHWLLPLFQPSSWSLMETIALLHSPQLGKVLNYRYVPLSLQNWLRDLVMARSDGTSLLNWLRDGKRTLSESELAGHATTLLLEGYETSAMLLAFALHELACNEDIQDNLLRELDESGGSGLLDEFRYTEAVLLETLRLHPAMQALQKRCTKSFELPAQKKDKGCRTLEVKEGTVLVIPVQAIHLDPKLYPAPHQFQPQRFLDQSAQSMGCRFLGFGAGSRMCPGMRLGLMQTKAALATLLKDQRVVLADETQRQLKISPLTFLTSAKKGVWLRLVNRKC
ncbi:hypothetical protein KR026_012031 [Drosophila bipectinata]|nr:hypothetical protein KR026_012031 [Drosophila bipectinata]